MAILIQKTVFLDCELLPSACCLLLPAFSSLSANVIVSGSKSTKCLQFRSESTNFKETIALMIT